MKPKEQDEKDMDKLESRPVEKMLNLKLQSDVITLLEKYSVWLMHHGYMDTDWKDEEPFAIDEFMIELKIKE